MNEKGNITAAVLVIGDEILSGRTQDTNTNYIARFLGAMGIDLREHDLKFLTVTMSEKGIRVLSDAGSYHSPARAREVYDVSGAGDTAIAAFTLALAVGANGIEAAEIANHAAGVVVAKLGTATLTIAELREMFVKTEGLS